MKRQHEFATRAIHAGQEPDPTTGAIMTPIYATSTYVQESPGKHKGFDYARSINPTRLAYEKCIADLESGTRGFAFASGLAAMSTALELLDSGSHIVVSDDLYGGTFRLFDKVRRRSANLDFTYVDLTDASRFEIGDQKEHANGLDRNAEQSAAQDYRSRSDRENRARTQNHFRFRQHLRQPVDSTADRIRLRYRRSFGDEIFERTLRSWSAASRLSATTRSSAIRCAFLQNSVGAIAGAFDSFLVLRSLKTLALRMERHCANALEIARWLEEQPQVKISQLSRT